MRAMLLVAEVAATFSKIRLIEFGTNGLVGPFNIDNWGREPIVLFSLLVNRVMSSIIFYKFVTNNYTIKIFQRMIKSKGLYHERCF
jgi:hypothetical protein